MSQGYEVHLHPPAYPDALWPSRCRHDPEFVMQAAVKINPRARRAQRIEIEHRVCFACGLSLGATYGGNVLVDLQMIWEALGWHARIGSRVLTLQQKWSRIAYHLFGPDGWNGRHERVARLIDPHLTMRIEAEPIGGGRYVGRALFDKSYLRDAA